MAYLLWTSLITLEENTHQTLVEFKERNDSV